MAVKTAVKVISLSSATARRESFTRDAQAAVLPWEFYSAHTGVVPPLCYDERKAVRRFGRPLSAGEIGAYTSHYKVWEWLAKSDVDQAFIFEDDVYVDWGAINELGKHDFSSMGIDMFRMLVPHAFKQQVAIHRFLSLHSHLLRGKGLMLGAAGYLLTRKGAAALLKGGEVVHSPSDWVLARYWEHGLPAYTLFPFPILEKYMPSTIGNSRAAMDYQMSPIDRVVRFYWKLRDRGLREWVERTKLRDNPFGETLDIGEPYLQKRSGR